MPPPPFTDRDTLLAALRCRLQRLENMSGVAERRVIPLCPGIDAVLPEGGLSAGALHEVVAPTGDPGGAAIGFAAVALGRTQGPVFWIAEEPDAWPPGLSRFGLEPHRLVMAQAHGTNALWAMEEVLRSPAVAGALLTASAPVDGTAARRLHLAARSGRAMGILLARETEAGVSVAETRWRVAPLPGHDRNPDDVGTPRWRLDLLRSRRGRLGSWIVCWISSCRELRLETDSARRTSVVTNPAERASGLGHGASGA